MRTAVIVIGDLGRSPRMQYHALALAVNLGTVDLIGLEGTPLHEAIAGDGRIRVHRLADRAFASRAAGGRRRFVLLSGLRAVAQGARLLATLLRADPPDAVLVQSPPATPTLAVAWLAARWRGARLIIDWHNLAHTVLAVRLGADHRAVAALRRAERRWARRADAHLAVSAALAGWLDREFGVQAAVLYDRPAAAFTRTGAVEADAMWARLAPTLDLSARRVPIAVCPSSWTPDEDFDLLLEALERAERTLVDRRGPGTPDAPDLAVLLTGRGALKAEVERRLSRRAFTRIAVRTPWLEPGDYPRLVGMADAGICLHQSSSGLDLPMKLADFRGCGVPACAFDYAPVIREVLTPGREGVLFTEPGGLARILVALATGHASEVPELWASKAWLAAHPSERWDDHWRERVPGLVRGARPDA
ncbi:MAG: glycosyltransferase [Acidobacteriota bacterium]